MARRDHLDELDVINTGDIAQRILRAFSPQAGQTEITESSDRLMSKASVTPREIQALRHEIQIGVERHGHETYVTIPLDALRAKAAAGIVQEKPLSPAAREAEENSPPEPRERKQAKKAEKKIPPKPGNESKRKTPIPINTELSALAARIYIAAKMVVEARTSGGQLSADTEGVSVFNFSPYIKIRRDSPLGTLLTEEVRDQFAGAGVNIRYSSKEEFLIPKGDLGTVAGVPANDHLKKVHFL